MKKRPKYHLPALKCVIGDWVYYVTAMRLSEVAALVKPIEEVHQSKKLCEWIQRRLIEGHAPAIAHYLRTEQSRFFASIVVGVFGGAPRWSPLSVSDPKQILSVDEEDRINRTVGVLTLSGEEDLFPVDGQHRVAGIKAAVEDGDGLRDEEVTVIIVGHERTTEGQARTRRLFVTLNQRAKKVSARDIIALDEDNGLAAVTRRMFDEFDLFRGGEIISLSGSANIPESDRTAITSIVGLFQIVKWLYPRKPADWPKPTIVQRTRPDDTVLEEIYEYNCSYWTTLAKSIKEYGDVLVSRKRPAGDYRTAVRNHLLFRPAGQAAFARAAECLVSRGAALRRAISRLIEKTEFSLSASCWHDILWDPITRKMRWDTAAAETLLLRNLGEEPRTEKAGKRLEGIIAERKRRMKA